MINVVGLGKIGCGIAEKFRQYPQYKVFIIDSGLKEKKDEIRKIDVLTKKLRSHKSFKDALDIIQKEVKNG